MKVAAFLPVKGSSERIENKNTALLNGKPLFLHTLEKLMRCPCIDEVYLDTEKDEIYEMARYTGCRYLKRDPALATNKTDGHALFYNEAVKVDAGIYIQILGTSPFITIASIERGIEILKNNQAYDSVVLVKKEKQYTWTVSGPAYDREHIPNSKDLSDTVIETMGLYMTTKDAALQHRKRYGIRPYLLEARPIEEVDVNYPEDFVLADMIAKGLKSIEIRKLKFLSVFVNSAMFSDILDDFGLHNAVITGLRCDISGTKLFGRARTLKIRKLKEGEDFKGIYHALHSYLEITDNDIIIVENECPEFAYFGELNTLLSIRAGASGTIVGGVTRDRDTVIQKGYPVFSSGYNCQDVRNRAVLDHYNRPICISGVPICPQDLVFADNDGVIVIPAEFEKKILDAVMEKVSMENNVAREIARYADPLDIIRKIGAF
jgi:CMP-N-acetylneuraminic acid synthetase/regulator of RNase E activity RraA